MLIWYPQIPIINLLFSKSSCNINNVLLISWRQDSFVSVPLRIWETTQFVNELSEVANSLSPIFQTVDPPWNMPYWPSLNYESSPDIYTNENDSSP
jgi:hypothetical protein